MPNTDMLGQGSLPPEVDAFASLLAQQGIPAALAYLNRRTPHRYTSLFRFDGDELRPQVLFDANHLARQPAQEVQLAKAYCALVSRQPAGLDSMAPPAESPAGKAVPPLLFYHSVLIRDAQGGAYGTLCHYDWQRCQPRTTDLPLLEAAATLLYAHGSLSH